MAEIVIKKKLPLNFLGDEYKESYLVFKSISIAEYSELSKQLNEATDSENKALEIIVGILEKQFIDGLFEGQKVTKEDIRKFDAETIMKCFQSFTGQEDPKDGGQ